VGDRRPQASSMQSQPPHCPGFMSTLVPIATTLLAPILSSLPAATLPPYLSPPPHLQLWCWQRRHQPPHSLLLSPQHSIPVHSLTRPAAAAAAAHTAIATSCCCCWWCGGRTPRGGHNMHCSSAAALLRLGAAGVRCCACCCHCCTAAVGARQGLLLLCGVHPRVVGVAGVKHCHVVGGARVGEHLVRVCGVTRCVCRVCGECLCHKSSGCV
jgi:hypothetical protein